MNRLDRRRQPEVLVVAVTVAISLGSALAAQKGGPTKTVAQHWPCQLTLRDAVDEAGNPADAIMSDGAGSYVNGQDGDRVRCKIADAPGTAHDGWLEMFIDVGSTRHMLFPGMQAQTAYTRNGYTTFQNQGSFQVKSIKTADTVGVTYLRSFRAYVEDPQFGGRIRLMGDSLALAPTDRFTPDLRGTSSIFAHRFDDCSWQVTADPTYPLTPGEGAQLPRVLGLIEEGRRGPLRSADFAMRFSATVRIIGVKPGCGAP